MTTPRCLVGGGAERASIILIGAAVVAVVIGLSAWLGFFRYDSTEPTHTPGATSPVVLTPITLGQVVRSGMQSPHVSSNDRVTLSWHRGHLGYRRA